MSLPKFDREKHHIGLGLTDADLKGFLVTGAYSKGFRRILGSDMVGTHYGTGESLVNVPGLSSWQQDDFSGGAYQYVWGKDPAMWASSKNFLPSQFARSLRSVPPLVPWLGVAGTKLTTTEKPGMVCAFGGYIFALLQASLERWDISTGAHTSLALGPGSVGYASALSRDDGVMFQSATDIITRIGLGIFGVQAQYSPPTGKYGDVTGIDASGGRLAVAFQNVLWTVPLPDNRTQLPPDVTWTRIGRIPGKWVASSYYSGLLYMLLTNSDMQTQLVAFDGTSILPITDFPYNFVGESMQIYGGRIYVGGSGRDVITALPRYAELYEVTGASLRLIRTFAPERWGAGGGYPTSIPSMGVHEGLLYVCLAGIGLVTYDLTTDSFYGASVFQPTDTTAMATKFVSGREDLFAWVGTQANDAGKSGWFRPATSQETIAAYSSELETSDFAVSIDRLKRWKQVRALVRFPVSDLTVKYSLDGGLTWSASLTGATTDIGNITLVTFDLSTIAESRQIRFKFSVPSGTNVSSIREFLAHTVSFRLLESDVLASGGKEKRAWVLTVGGMDRMEAADGTTIVQDLETIRDTLWSWARERKALRFYDLDSTPINVEIDTLDEFQPTVLPPVGYHQPDTQSLSDDTEAREAFYKLTLVEV